MGLQRLRRPEPADGVEERQPGAHRLLVVVLVRLGIAEIDQHAVAHVFGDKTGEAGDRVGDAMVIGADDFAQILGIEAPRQRRRADQIAEHYRQLATLSFNGDRSSGAFRLCGGLRRVTTKGRDRRQHPAAMSD